MMTDHEPASPRIFAPSSLQIDDSKLCFNKTHFSRPDFDVQRFMNLARRQAGLEQIQKDLRLYLKSIQHSMIELINDDYADFVHLSSNLVSLQSSIDKIDKDIQNIWTEFENSTVDSVGTAEQVELRCNQLSFNRKRQTELRDTIAFLSSLQKLQNLLSLSSISLIWLEKVASCVVDLTLFADHNSLDETSKEGILYKKILSSLEQILCKEAIRSANEDCSTLPLVLSVISLIKSSDVLTAALVSDYLQPKLVTQNSNHFELLKSVLAGVHMVRENWQKMLGTRFSGNLSFFLDQTLLTFILTFLEKCLGMVVVPTDTKVFHKCFLIVDDCIRTWPSSSQHRSLLKSIRDKFNFLVYFKLTTYKLSKQIDSHCSSEVTLVTEEDERLKCSVSAAVLSTIETVWNEDVFLYPLIDKFWDFTLKMLFKQYSWAQHVLEVIKSDEYKNDNIPVEKCLLYLRSDLKNLHSAAFDLCLEQIWTKLRDMEIETTSFGQCLTWFGQRIDTLCMELDTVYLDIVSKSIEKELDAASDIPKYYRWTRKPAPTSTSPYLATVLEKMKSLERNLQEIEVNSDGILSNILTNLSTYFVDKLSKVLEGTEMHSSSRLLVSRKTPGIGASDGFTDNDKIKIQIFHDLVAFNSFLNTKSITVDSVLSLIERCRPDSQDSPLAPTIEQNSSVEQEVINGKKSDEQNEDIYRVSSQASREGSA